MVLWAVPAIGTPAGCGPCCAGRRRAASAAPLPGAEGSRELRCCCIAAAAEVLCRAGARGRERVPAPWFARRAAGTARYQLVIQMLNKCQLLLDGKGRLCRGALRGGGVKPHAARKGGVSAVVGCCRTRKGSSSTPATRSRLSCFKMTLSLFFTHRVNSPPPAFSFLLKGANIWEIPYCTVTYFTAFFFKY